jgi:putative glutathione S-transferase
MGGFGMLVDGQWVQDWRLPETTGPDGAFVRESSGFRNWVTPDGAAGPMGRTAFPATSGRYHLYVALSCPWASRVLIARRIKGLEQLVSVTILEPSISHQGWRFGDGEGSDPLYHATYLHEIYTRADPHFTGRVTVPVLFDIERETIVNNESADILRIFDTGFGHFAHSDVTLYPEDLQLEIDALNERIYIDLNDGVYRAGFATGQAAYDSAFQDVFSMLDVLEARLSISGPFLFGTRFSETDIRLFVTLVRFDAAYFGLFKCNLRRLSDYPALSTYLRHVIALPGVRETVDIDAIKQGYYSVKALNPNGIVPGGPDLSDLL